MPETTCPNIVVCVHGTWASTEEDAWYQPESSFAREMNALLCNRATCASEAEVFRWSGMNLESHRREAGKKLFEHLRSLQNAGKAIHLIGHSHGGGVIWHALIESIRRKQPLWSLKTWCTLGTPFMTFAAEPFPWKLLVFLLASFFGNFAVLGVASEFWKDAPVLLGDHREQPVIVECLLIVGYLAAVGISLRAIWTNLQARGNLGKLAAWQREAYLEYGLKRVSLASPLDEAINGLNMTTKLAGPVAPRMKRQISGNIGERIAAVLFWPVAWVFNRLIAPILDRLIWQSLIRRAQGLDIEGVYVTHVGRTPGFGAPEPELNEEEQAEMLSYTNESARDAVVALRQALATIATDGLGTYQILDDPRVSSAGLIHNSYYASNRIRSRLAAFIEADIAPAGVLPQVVREPKMPFGALVRPWLRAVSSGLLGLLLMMAFLAAIVSYHEAAVARPAKEIRANQADSVP